MTVRVPNVAGAGAPGQGSGSVAAFGEPLSESFVPRAQIDAIEGLRSGDVEQFTDGASGSVAVTDSQFVCTTGTSIGGYGVVSNTATISAFITFRED